jgi:hypothetical protein
MPVSLLRDGPEGLNTTGGYVHNVASHHDNGLMRCRKLWGRIYLRLERLSKYNVHKLGWDIALWDRDTMNTVVSFVPDEVSSVHGESAFEEEFLKLEGKLVRLVNGDTT